MVNRNFLKGLCMEKKGNVVKENLIPVAKTIVVTAIVTIVLLMVLALLLLKAGLEDKTVLIGIGVIYFAANMAGGFIIGKVKEKRRFIWGIAVGVTYFLILSLVSFLVTGQVYQGDMPVIAGLLCCVGGGFVGGIIS